MRLSDLNNLSFSEVKPGKYPCYDFSINYIKKGPLYVSALSIVNEILVDLFLEEKISYVSISELMVDTLSNEKFDQEMSFDNIIGIREILNNKILKKIQ